MSLDLVAERIQNVRNYTQSLLADIEDELWFVKPPGCPTHVGWQVGHIAMGQYAAGLMRVRDAQPGDRDLMSREFRRQFSKGSEPLPAEQNPSPEELRRVFNVIYEQLLRELPTFDEVELGKPLAAPHAMFKTKLGALHFTADHEMLHAGQIGLLRRMLGKPPVR